jgi:Uma2 family endonuclease
MSPMVQTPVKQITLAEFLDLPETKPASEYIDGQIIQKPIPQGHHSIIQMELGTEISLTLRRQGIATAFPELRCTFGDRSIVPDLAVFETARVPNHAGEIDNVFTSLSERGFANAPDWTIEILSPGQSANKVLKNINHCLAHGTQMGWLIVGEASLQETPEDRSVIISRIGHNADVIDEPTAILPVPEFAKSMQITIGQMLGWLSL